MLSVLCLLYAAVLGTTSAAKMEAFATTQSEEKSEELCRSARSPDGYAGRCLERDCCQYANFVEGLCPDPVRPCCFGPDACAACPGMEMVRRSSWQASLPPEALRPLRKPSGYVIVHQTSGESCSDQVTCSKVVRSIQSYHVSEKGLPDIGFNFLIGGDGKIYEGTGWENEGYKNELYNNASLSVAFIGNFEKRPPTPSAIAAFRALVSCSVEKGHLVSGYSLSGHSDVRCVRCPGGALYSLLSKWDNYKGKLSGFVCA